VGCGGLVAVVCKGGSCGGGGGEWGAGEEAKPVVEGGQEAVGGGGPKVTNKLKTLGPKEAGEIPSRSYHCSKPKIRGKASRCVNHKNPNNKVILVLSYFRVWLLPGLVWGSCLALSANAVSVGVVSL